ncbi:MAG: site-specific DNA-methyltransferase [Phycisphaerales bacterium]|nr:site-specific DNA-methyltransferase [Phycisphaerales bacterium]
MRGLPDGLCDLIYVDPPFGTGVIRRGSAASYADRSSPEAFIRQHGPRLAECRRLLSRRGTLYVHLDYRTAHLVRTLLDDLFGRSSFLNEVIWSYRTGGNAKRHFARKHDNILVYAQDPDHHIFHVLRSGEYRTDGLRVDEAGRPYKTTRKGRVYFHPGGPAMTDVWDIPFLSTVASERTGYPSQKPLALLERVVLSSSDPGSVVGDFYCGSGTSLVAAARHNRRYLGCDLSPQAVEIARCRLREASLQGESSDGEKT